MLENYKNSSRSTQLVVQGAMIAALYVVLSYATYTFSYYQIQCRVSEALCMTIFFTPAGIWGMTIGCLITNLLAPQITWFDIVFGTMATLIASLLTVPIANSIRSRCGDNLDIKHSLLLPIPTVIVNALIIPFVLYYGYGFSSIGSFTAKYAVLGITALTIAAGEIVSCYVFGPIVVKVMNIVRMGLDRPQ